MTKNGVEPTEEELQKAYVVDANKDGKITLEECLAFMFKRFIEGTDQDVSQDKLRNWSKYEKYWKKYNNNGDETVTKDDLIASAKEAGKNPTEEKLEVIMKSMDANGDDKVTKEEFCDFMNNMFGC